MEISKDQRSGKKLKYLRKFLDLVRRVRDIPLFWEGHTYIQTINMQTKNTINTTRQTEIAYYHRRMLNKNYHDKNLRTGIIPREVYITM